MDLVTCLLDFRLNLASHRSIVPRLAASLAACAQLSALGEDPLPPRLCLPFGPTAPGMWSSYSCDLLYVCVPAAGHRMWALQRLRRLLTTEFGQSMNISRLLGDDGETRALVGSSTTGPSAPRWECEVLIGLWDPGITENTVEKLWREGSLLPTCLIWPQSRPPSGSMPFSLCFDGRTWL